VPESNLVLVGTPNGAKGQQPTYAPDLREA